MACDPQTFDDIGPDAWALMQSEVQRQLGIGITTPSGQAADKGFTIGWNYDAGGRTLTITCLDKPFFVPCGVINGQIAKLVDQARSGG